MYKVRAPAGMACDGNVSAFARGFGNPSHDPGAHDRATEKDGSQAQTNAVAGARVLIWIKKQYGLIAGGRTNEAAGRAAQPS